MVDVASLSFSIDSSDAQRADQALARLTSTSQRAEAGARTFGSAAQRASGSLAGLTRATQQGAATTRAAQQGAARLGRSIDSLDRSYDQAAASAGAFGRAAGAAGRGISGLGGTAKAAGGQVGNMAAQLQDIGVQAAAMQSPLQIAIQQGTQLSAVFGQLGQGVSPIRALGTAFASVVSPVSLATIGVIAGGTALVQWGIKAATAGRETRNLSDAVEDAEDRLSAYKTAVDDATASMDDLEERFGSGANAIRPFLQEVVALQQAMVQTDIDAFGQSLRGQFTGTGIGSIFRTLEGSLNQVFNLNSLREATGLVDDFGTGLAVLPSHVEDLRSKFFSILDGFEEAKGDLATQGEILEQMYATMISLAEADGKRTKSENEYLQLVAQARVTIAETLGVKEQDREATEQISRAEERRLEWAKQTLARMQAQEATSLTIAEHGANSAAAMDQQLKAAQASLATELKRRGITGELARSLQEALVAQQNANVAAEERQRYDREAQRLAQEREQSAQRELQLAVQREHAEANIAQRLQNRIEVARAIVVHGKDSVQAKLAEEAVSRRLFELDLDRHGITGDIRQQLIGQYQAAAQLEAQIVQAQPAFQGLQQTIAGISNAWGEFVVSGFRDFKDFTQNVLNQFKRLLAQMIAQAAQNKIMFNMGMGGIGGAPQGGGGGGLMGMLGGGGGGGSPLSFLGKMFGGGGGSGGGMFSGPFGGGLKNAAFNMGLIHGPAIAGGGAAALASGAATSAAFGFGPAAGIGAGGLTAGGGAMAATGLTGLGTALAVAAPIAVLGLALMKSSKTIDRGTKIIVDGLTATAEGYRTVQESRFFGLSKRERDRGETLESGIQSEWDAFLSRHMRQLGLSARLFGLNTDKLSEFSSTVMISGSESDKGAAKIAELTREMEGMLVAGTALEGKLEEMGVNLWDLAGTFVQVDAILKDLHGQRIARGPGGAVGAADLAGQFGGIGGFQSAAAAFYEGFFSAGERMDHLRAQVTDTLQGIATETPGVMGDAVSAYSTALNTMRGLTGDVSEAMSTVYRELVQAQDLNTEAGRALYAELLQLAPSMRTLIDHEKGLAEARMEAAEAARLAAEAEAERALEIEQAAASARGRNTPPGSNNRFYDRSRVGQVNNPYESWWLVGPGSAERNAPGGVNPFDQGANIFPRRSERFGDTLAESVANWSWLVQTGGAGRFNQGGGGIRRVEPLPELRDTSQFFQTFYGTIERSPRIVPDLTEAFAKLNLTMPDTRAGFRELVEAQDLTTQSGRLAYNSLIDLSGQFASMTGEAMELNDALGLTRDVFRDVREEAFARSAQGQGGGRMVQLSPDAIRQIAAAVSTGDVGAARIVSAIDRFADRNARDFEDYIEIAERDFYEPTTETVDLS